MYKSKLYKKAPVLMQELLINIKALIYKVLRENYLYKNRLKELLKNTQLSREELTALNKKLLTEQIDYAKKHCDFYQSINSSKIEDFPVILKDNIKEMPGRFISNDKNIKYFFKSQTGGTTGKPLQLKANLMAIIEDHAQSSRQITWAGLQPSGKKLWLRADLIVPLDQSYAPFWRRNIVDNMLMMSVYHINANTVAQYVDKINSYKPELIQAYPSSICLLAQLIDSSEHKIETPINAIILSSESFTKEESSLIERVFNSKVYSWYGLSERVATVGTCNQGYQHLIEDYGYYEFDQNNQLLATGFHNKAMPLIRYNTGDEFIDVDLNYEPCLCGLPFKKVGGIKGRTGDYLVASNGNKVTIFNHIPKEVTGLIELQLEQTHKLKLIAKVVVGSNFNMTSNAQLIKNVKHYLGQDMEVEVITVDRISRTKSGKFRQVIYSVEP
ncbi:phenylacetate--CoA ligase family protein [Pseudoalteromonas marina]|jgi:phenylacetate-CoA ligase|uniref:Uncharacterized protein n=1 Tax=Pseudoalteromonas marina TaxID=267375 RepID=A0ABT9FBD8_9GAMM|nr:hypothetical protein [Pseudoalteromonas marina]MDP2564048.1 hypothetical protein [Pseudoalteromonas marina]